MGHLMRSVNPDAVDRMADEGKPLPAVGTMVQFHPRPGEARMRRLEVPALVMARDESNRRLELLVIFAHDDQMMQPNVPEYVAGERGWTRLETDQSVQIAALQGQVATLTAALFGSFEPTADASAFGMLDDLDGRVGKLEDGQTKPQTGPKAAKRVRSLRRRD